MSLTVKLAGVEDAAILAGLVRVAGLIRPQFAICIMLLFGMPASADSFDVAVQMGAVLGSEKPCRLKFRVAKVDAYIKNNVAEGDKEFPAQLKMMKSAVQRTLSDMSVSEKNGHCANVREIALNLGFLSK